MILAFMLVIFSIILGNESLSFCQSNFHIFVLYPIANGSLSETFCTDTITLTT
uniref:Uncharacterized protein n=1 Tax=Anguilla anguilla TaxID=7936 RepID=A0A0E9REJ8_ANGAN